MSTTTTTAAPASTTRRPVAVRPVTQARVVASEWIKLRSLRSSWFTFTAAVVGMIGISLLIAYFTNSRWSTLQPAERLTFDPTSRSLSGVFLAQLAVGVLGVLAISGEYATGMIGRRSQSCPAVCRCSGPSSASSRPSPSC